MTFKLLRTYLRVIFGSIVCVIIGRDGYWFRVKVHFFAPVALDMKRGSSFCDNLDDFSKRVRQLARHFNSCENGGDSKSLIDSSHCGIDFGGSGSSESSDRRSERACKPQPPSPVVSPQVTLPSLAHPPDKEVFSVVGSPRVQRLSTILLCGS